MRVSGRTWWMGQVGGKGVISEKNILCFNCFWQILYQVVKGCQSVSLVS